MRSDPRCCRRQDGMGKIGFATKKHAKRFLRGIRARGLATAGMDAYRCPFCDLFHLGRRRTT